MQIHILFIFLLIILITTSIQQQTFTSSKRKSPKTSFKCIPSQCKAFQCCSLNDLCAKTKTDCSRYADQDQKKNLYYKCSNLKCSSRCCRNNKCASKIKCQEKEDEDKEIAYLVLIGSLLCVCMCFVLIFILIKGKVMQDEYEEIQQVQDETKYDIPIYSLKFKQPNLKLRKNSLQKLKRPGTIELKNLCSQAKEKQYSSIKIKEINA